MAPIWQHRDDVAWTDGVDRVVVLDLRRPTEPGPMAFEGSAAAIWTAIDGTRDTDQVITAVAEVYEIDPTVVAAEVRTFISDLVARDLIAEAPDSPRVTEAD
jgi:hypothetical protein